MWAAPSPPIIYANYDYIAKVANRVGEADALMVTTQAHDAASVEAQSDALENHFERVGVRVSMVTTLPNERAEAEVAFDAIVALLLVMAILLALVGGLGLMGTMSINVLERTREIGVLRAIGAPNRGVAQVFILEGIAIGLLSWVMGALLAIPMSQGLNEAVGGAMMGVPLTYAYSMPGLLAVAGCRHHFERPGQLYPRPQRLPPDRPRSAGVRITNKRLA